jgi:hypothetical protein
LVLEQCMGAALSQRIRVGDLANPSTSTDLLQELASEQESSPKGHHANRGDAVRRIGIIVVMDTTGTGSIGRVAGDHGKQVPRGADSQPRRPLVLHAPPRRYVISANQNTRREGTKIVGSFVGESQLTSTYTECRG